MEVFALVKRENWREIATSLHEGRERVGTLNMPKDRLHPLVTLALSLTLQGSDGEALSHKDFMGAADNIVNTFTCQGKVDIDFEMFDNVWTTVAVSFS